VEIFSRKIDLECELKEKRSQKWDEKRGIFGKRAHLFLMSIKKRIQGI
jgi:hypothetical protein